MPVSGNYSKSSGGVIISGDLEVGKSNDFDLVLILAGGDPSKIEQKNWRVGFADWILQVFQLAGYLAVLLFLQD